MKEEIVEELSEGGLFPDPEKLEAFTKQGYPPFLELSAIVFDRARNRVLIEAGTGLDYNLDEHGVTVMLNVPVTGVAPFSPPSANENSNASLVVSVSAVDELQDVIDRIERVTDDDAYRMKGRLAREEGLLVGISAGANVVAALRVAEELGEGKTVVTLLCDTGERYFSLDEYFE